MLSPATKRRNLMPRGFIPIRGVAEIFIAAHGFKCNADPGKLSLVGGVDEAVADLINDPYDVAIAYLKEVE